MDHEGRVHSKTRALKVRALTTTDTKVILKVFSIMFSTQTALDYREQCFGGQAQSLIAAKC